LARNSGTPSRIWSQNLLRAATGGGYRCRQVERKEFEGKSMEGDAEEVPAETLAAWLTGSSGGPPQGAQQLFTALYRELHRLARHQLHRSGGVSISATTLLHEAYLDLSGRAATFPDRARFFGYAARAMRGLIIDHLRSRHALKRGGEFHLTALDTEVAESVAADELGPLSAALDELALIDAPLAELVELKFFCGFSFTEIAGLRGVSERTVQRDWAKARLLLHDRLRSDD
jgi:RNA polymerase sigma factor (TIGR02999 family)